MELPSSSLLPLLALILLINLCGIYGRMWQENVKAKMDVSNGKSFVYQHSLVTQERKTIGDILRCRISFTDGSYNSRSDVIALKVVELMTSQ